MGSLTRRKGAENETKIASAFGFISAGIKLILSVALHQPSGTNLEHTCPHKAKRKEKEKTNFEVRTEFADALA